MGLFNRIKEKEYLTKEETVKHLEDILDKNKRQLILVDLDIEITRGELKKADKDKAEKEIIPRINGLKNSSDMIKIGIDIINKRLEKLTN